MFYQAIPHKEQKCNDAADAARIILKGSIPSYTALSWRNENGKFYAVSNTHIDDYAFAETAIIEQKGDEFFLRESITVGWIKSPERVAKLFLESETSEFRNKTQLIIGEPKNEKAWFTCGCCGESFHDSVKKQIAFNQDQGYGICKACENLYS